MDPIERGLQPVIPLGEAASFFLKLKHGSASPSEKQASELRGRLRECAKEKNSEGMALPDTGMGKNMAAMPVPALPTTGMGQNPVKLGAARGPSRAQERAHEQLETKYEKHKHTKGERNFTDFGGLTGAAAGGTAAHKFGKSPAATAAGILAGYASGRALGKSVGTSHDAHMFERSKHAMFKRALEEQGMAPASSGEDGEVPIDAYLQAQQGGVAAEEENQAAYLRERLQMAQEQLQQAQQEAQMSQQSAQQLQQSQAAHEQQMQSMQQQAQMATDAAMQNVQQAHELALKATSQALQSKDDAINTHQMAAQMRMSYQDMRGHIMDTVAQDDAAPIGEAIKAKGMESQVMPPGGGAPAEGEAPDPQNVGPGGQPQEAGPAGQTAAPAAPPGSPPPTGDDHGAQAAGDGQGANPLEQAGGDAQPAGQFGVKQAGAWGTAARQFGGQLKSRLPYMAVGATVGAGLPLIEAGMGHEGLRARVGQLQTRHDQEGGFGTALMLAQSKMRLALGEIAENHPGAAALTGGALGAVAGAVQGPDIYRSLMDIPDQIKELRK